jgi:hypothetical protein
VIKSRKNEVRNEEGCAARIPYFRTQINVLGALWGGAVIYIIYQLPNPPQKLLFASLLFPAYYTALTLWLEYRRIMTSTGD